MSSAPIINLFADAGQEVIEIAKGCLREAHTIAMLDDALPFVTAFFNNRDVSITVKRRTSSAIKNFSRWCLKQEPRIERFFDVTPQHVTQYLSGFAKAPAKKVQRVGLENLYAVLVEGGYVQFTPVKVPKAVQTKDVSLPELVVALGDKAVAATRAFLNETMPLWELPKVKGSPHLTVFRDCLRDMQAKGITRFSDITAQDAEQYLKAVENDRTRAQYSSMLRRMTDVLMEAGVVTANPFLRHYETASYKQQAMHYINEFAKRSGPHIMDGLDKFCTFKDATRVSPNHQPALNHFAQWMEMFGGAKQISEISHEHLLVYREEGLAMFKKSTKEEYFSSVTQMFDFLHELKLLPQNPAAEFRSGKTHAYVSKGKFIAPKHARTMMKIKREQPKYEKPTITKIILFQAFDNFPYEQRYMFATFVDYVMRCDKNLKDDRLDKRIPKNYQYARSTGKLGRSPLGESYWQKAHVFGACVYEDGLRRFSPAFIEAYNAPNSPLQADAQKFLAEHRANLAQRIRHLNIKPEELKVA